MLEKENYIEKNLNETIYDNNEFIFKNNPIDYCNKIIKDSKLSEVFELVDLIKCSSESIIVKAKLKKPHTNKNIALKFLFHQKKYNRKDEINFHFEDHSAILIRKKLKHKNISDIYGYYKVKEGSCLAMEFAKNGDLENFRKTILKKPYFSETLICFLSYQILEAISYLHINKILYMDICK